MYAASENIPHSNSKANFNAPTQRIANTLYNAYSYSYP
jgi:hypothetical protein